MHVGQDGSWYLVFNSMDIYELNEFKGQRKKRGHVLHVPAAPGSERGWGHFTSSADFTNCKGAWFRSPMSEDFLSMFGRDE